MANLAYVKHRMKCPRHFVLKPGHNAWLMVPNPLLKNMPEWAIKKWKLTRWIAKKDRFGNKIRDDRSFYQPEISSAFAIEHIYDPLNPICKHQCRGRCLEGKGTVNTHIIKRLS